MIELIILIILCIQFQNLHVHPVIRSKLFSVSCSDSLCFPLFSFGKGLFAVLNIGNTQFPWRAGFHAGLFHGIIGIGRRHAVPPIFGEGAHVARLKISSEAGLGYIRVNKSIKRATVFASVATKRFLNPNVINPLKPAQRKMEIISFISALPSARLAGAPSNKASSTSS